MRDCVIVGSGRSGTSLAAGLLARAGYNCGDDLLPPDEGGPTGFFEARRMNSINEALLSPHDAQLRTRGYSRPLRDGERWLAVLPDDAEVEASPELTDEMSGAIPPTPYCCKDPRFGYTLDAWRDHFARALFVCVFRHPVATAASIAKQVRYEDLIVDAETSLEIWNAIYRRVLNRLRCRGDWLFVHYEQLFGHAGVERLSRALDAPLDPGFADPALYRSQPTKGLPSDCAPLYRELCALAGYSA